MQVDQGEPLACWTRCRYNLDLTMIGWRVEASIRQQVEVHLWTAAIAKSGAPEQHQMQKHLGALLFNTPFARPNKGTPPWRASERESCMSSRARR